MTNERRFYTYAYLREDGTPYYIGKGNGSRAYSKQGRSVSPPPKERILLLKTGLTEEQAFRHEVYMIALYGRKDIGTGILWNFTDGGEGTSGYRHTNKGKKLSPDHIEKLRGREMPPETREKIRQTLKGRARPPEVIEKIRQGNLGKKVSEETREKLRQSHLGYKPSEEHRENLRQAGLRRWERKRAEGG